MKTIRSVVFVLSTAIGVCQSFADPKTSVTYEMAKKYYESDDCFNAIMSFNKYIVEDSEYLRSHADDSGAVQSAMDYCTKKIRIDMLTAGAIGSGKIFRPDITIGTGIVVLPTW